MASVTTFLNSAKSTGTWKLVPGESTLAFENTTMWGALKVRGAFTEFSGTGTLKDTSTVSGTIEINPASLETGLGLRNKDLQGRNFFDVERYPQIVVVVKGGKPAGGDTVALDAELTVKSITGPMPMKARVVPGEDGSVRLVADTVVTRKQFAVEGNFFGSVGPKTKLHADLVFKHA